MGNRRAGWAVASTFAAIASVAGADARAATGGAEAAGPGSAAQAAGPLSPASGRRLERKLADILRHALEPSSEVRLTRLPETEVNAWLAYQGTPYLPVGIREPVVRIGDGRLTAEAVIDLDAIRESRDRTAFDLIRYLGGQLVVTAGGGVRSGGGMAQVDVERVTVGGIEVPVQVLQEVVRHFTRTPEQPGGTRLDEPIPLPYGITELRLSSGLAVIVQ